MSADFKKDPSHGHDVKHVETPLHASKGYETLDAQAGATYRAGFYILGAMFVTAALVVPMYWLLARRETAAQQRPASVVQQDAAAAQASFPRLVVSEPAVLAEYLANEDELLNGWGWVEKDRGIARMPVAEALRIVGERGALPAFPAPAPPGTGQDQPAASPSGGDAR